ncbi:uncharacterized protein LOC120946865 [Rana temporaria]|uniref:uncharacterized protein LOC120946865 n=1 Tax=Rana temporaria TaxID=8407 RepID=UPI001AAE061E|nr:uncharacterized protein LOC120946865 [Rana temporaria]XP_040217596.1 uncharacterized protein LOC120946865 [Rana temporaria]XP_040217597.1 uncharacterized protein LOC120946865 [Rana temporaria]
METSNEGEGYSLTRSTTASEQITEGPQTRDSDNNDSQFKEDTLQQMLTCETGNTGTEASTPPCDKGTTGQGLHGTSQTNVNLDKELDAISLIRLDEVAETDKLQRPTELEVTSSEDESGEWETASEASIANEETTDGEGEKKNENLDPEGGMDAISQKDTGENVKIWTSSGPLEKIGGEGTGEPPEVMKQCCERTSSEGLQSEQAFTHETRPDDTFLEESLCDVGKTASKERPPHAAEELKGTVNEEPELNVEEMATEETMSYFSTGPHIEKLNDEESVGEPDPHVEEMVIEAISYVSNTELNDEESVEEPGPGGYVTHVEKSSLYNEKAASEWTRSPEDSGSHNEEPAIKDIETQMIETANDGIEPQKNATASEVIESQLREAVYEMSEPHVVETLPHHEETVQVCRESLEVPDSESIPVVPYTNELVCIEPCSVEILSEQCSPPMEEAFSDGPGHHVEEAVLDPPKSHTEESANEVSPPNTKEPYIEETPSGETRPYEYERDCEGTVSHNGISVHYETGPLVGETVHNRTLNDSDYMGSGESETRTIDTNSEEAKSMSDHALRVELEANSNTKVIEENENSCHVTDEEQGPLDTNASKEDADGKIEMVNNEGVVDSQSAINKDSSVDQKEITEDEIGNDIFESVTAASKVTAQDHKEGVSQLLDGDTKGTVSKETEGFSIETVCQKISGTNEETVSAETEFVYPETTDGQTEGGHKENVIQTLKYETDADGIQTTEYKESVDKIPSVDHREILHTMRETLESENIEKPNEEETASFIETTEQGRESKDNIFIEKTLIEPSSKERELAKWRANQESAGLSMLVDFKELYGESLEIPPNIQYFVKESTAKEKESDPNGEGKSWYTKEAGLQVPRDNIETLRLEGESSNTTSGEIEAKTSNLEADEVFSEDILEAISHTRSFEIDVDQTVSINDGNLYMDVFTDTGTTISTAGQVPLDETMVKEIKEADSDKVLSLSGTETNSNSSMLVQPIPMRPLNFSNIAFQNLDVVHEPGEPNMQHFYVVDGNFHHKDTDSSFRESSLEETSSPSFQIETTEDQEQIQGVIQAARIVGPQIGIQVSQFLEDHGELAEDEPDCFNQRLIFDRGFKIGNFSPKIELFTKPETDAVFVPEATSTIADEHILPERTLSHVGPEPDGQGKVDLCINTGAVEDTGGDNPPLLLTRQRSNTDPGPSYDQEEIDQQDDQHEEKPRPRLRSVTPPLDNFTASFTATSPQTIRESKPLEKAQTSIVYPPVDYNMSVEQKAEEATPKQDSTFFPTRMQIFNPLFFIQESTEEQGFYQSSPLLPHGKENKRRMPSPPRDTEVLLKGTQPPAILSRSPASSVANVETTSTDPPSTHPIAPLWLPPRPLRHSENPLVRRPTVRHKRNTATVPPFKRFSAMNLPTIPQISLGDTSSLEKTPWPSGTRTLPTIPHEFPSEETSSLEKGSRPAGTKAHISTTRQRLLPRQPKINEQDIGQKMNKSPREILAEAEQSSKKSSRSPSPETVLRRGKRSQIQPSTSDTKHSMHMQYTTLIRSSSLLYQEYSDVALNQEIQRQKPGDSPAEEKDPGSPRQRRRILSSQDSYLQRLSISSADSLWQDLPRIRDSATFMLMSRAEQKLQEAKFELIMSEALYLRSLNIAVDHFQRSTELHEVLGAQDRQWLFSRLSEVRDASNDFLFDLEEEFENNMYNFQVCEVVISHEPNFRKVYLPYVTNQSYQDRTFQRLMNNNPRFQQVLSKLESDPVCQRLSLKSFLILPFQRITRLRLLLQNILKRSAPGSNEELQATEAHNAIEKLIRDCNEGVQKMKDTEELILLHQKIQFECKIFPLISASRRLVKHGEVTALEFNPISSKWKSTNRQVYLHLFSDCLMLSRIREGGRFVVFDHSSDIRVERCEIKLHSNQKNIFRVFLRDSAATQARDGHLEGHEMQYIFRTETQSQKLRWIYALTPTREEADYIKDGLKQVQCLKSYKARENDELSLEKADTLMVTQSSDDGWLCGMRLSDLHSGWFPQCHVQFISRNACLRNLQEEQRLRNARAKLHPAN